MSATMQTLLTVLVQTAVGRPLTNTLVVCFGPTAKVTLKSAAIEGGGERLITNDNGQFKIVANGTNLFVVVANDEGFCLAPVTDLKKQPSMILLPWGRISGVRMDHNHPLVNQPIGYFLDWRSVGSGQITYSFEPSERTTTDSQGHFSFEHVPPVEVLFYEAHNHPAKEWFSLPGRWEVGPDKVTEVKIATQGRTVIGHLVFASETAKNIDLTSCFGGLMADIDQHKFTLPVPSQEINTVRKRTEFWNDWYNSETGHQYLATRQSAGFEFRSDGSFIGEMVEPGNYFVSGWIERNGQKIAVLDKVHVTIPPVGANFGDDPYDIGKMTIKAAVNLNVGDMAPDFIVKTLDGNPLKLSSFRGKYVLFDFWATWCGPCVEEMPNLKATFNAYGKNNRFVMISLSLDPEIALPKKFVSEKGFGWTQVFLGAWSDDLVTVGYGVYGIPSIFLIGPDGRILATDLRGHAIQDAVAKAVAD